MKQWTTRHLNSIVMGGTIFIMLLVMSNINLSKDYSSGYIEADGKGYYAYLPAVFIYLDLHFSFFDSIENKKYYNSNHYYDYRTSVNGHTINKYYSGTSLALTPFFLAGHVTALLTHSDTDGFSKPYMIFANLGALFYLFLGLLFMVRFLTLYKIGKATIAMVIPAIVFGTNLFYYAVIEFSMSHVFSFAFITMFVYYVKKFFLTRANKYILFSGVVLGFIVLIRPVNMLIVLLVPFLAGNFKSLKTIFTYNRSRVLFLLASIFVVFLISGIQLVIYKVQTGNFWVYSYGEEGFNFGNPQMISILFSYKKGLFLYTPLLLVSIIGGIVYFLRKRYELITLLIFFLILVYTLSSWWMWFYGGSFSGRVFVEFYGIFGLLLGFTLLPKRKKIYRATTITLVVILTIICQIQTYQYRYYQIHWSDMTKEKYWENFLRIDKL